jgi:hypothetical protein
MITVSILINGNAIATSACENIDGQCGASWCNCDEKRKEQRSSAPAICSAARARIDDSVRQVWMAYRDASDVSVDMLTEQDMELWGIVTRHVAIQDRLNAMLPNDRS